MNNDLSYFYRLCLIRCPVLLQFRQMWLRSKVQNAFLALNSLSKPRKFILAAIVVLALLYYLLPLLFGLSKNKISTQPAGSCLEEKIQKEFYKSLGSLDTVVRHKPLHESEGEHAYPMYVGNGKIAAAFDSQNGAFIRLNRALSIPVKFYPVIQTHIDDKVVDEAFVLNMKSGIAYRLQSLVTPSGCVSIGSQIYAHRSRPTLFIQDIRIQNPTRFPIVVELDQTGASGWKGSKTEQYSAGSRTGDNIKYKVTSGLVKVPGSNSVVAAAFGMMFIDQNTLSVKSHSTVNYHIITVVQYTKPLRSQEANKHLPDLSKQVQLDMASALEIDQKRLRQEHVSVWARLWESGFSISHSRAAGVLNGEKINMTMYYVLSNVLAPLHDITTTKDQKTNILKVLYYPDHCYSEHSTLQAQTLWSDVTAEDQIAQVVTTWMITLENHGCRVMVQSGAEGVLQAMLLSLGALRFRDDHLEYAVHPKELHRDLTFRRINYGNNTHVNISVIVGDDNKASLFVALDRNDKPYYACDAGCLDPPMLLSRDWKRFPVKLTEPLTSILYITADKTHVEELKHVIHVKAVEEAPPHEHHVMALHKHGHHFGGLPTLFWVAIVFLILIFHLFLFKLIYNEYCVGQERYARTKYNM
ncbi:uncharacterized protein KIAA2013 homolog [Gigantopelta aegis]|uniref:uncharacterized protein KIAA2013 homolog n=1 Tax=Gigantopelta aegis TaxID=1735272 RepID=UPI001B88D287|nr:uncharacterized protein KIAA2013 homolog [Gigantopelta aegis]